MILCKSHKEFENHRKNVLKMMSHTYMEMGVCRHYYSLNNHLIIRVTFPHLCLDFNKNTSGL